MPGETEKQEGICIPVEHRIEPSAVSAALIFESCHFAVTAIYDRGELCNKTSQQKQKITIKSKQAGSQNRTQE